MDEHRKILITKGVKLSAVAILFLIVGMVIGQKSSLLKLLADGSRQTNTEFCSVHGVDKKLCFICDPALREPGRPWCNGHDRYEDRCWLCNPELEDKSRPWCQEHHVYEDECGLCNGSRPSGIDARGRKSQGELEGANCEHGVPVVDCDNCRFEVGVVKIDPALATLLIKTDVVEEVEHNRVLQFTGQVQLDLTRTVDVVPAGGGQIKRVLKFLGDHVEKGDVLAVIHSTALGQAKADYLAIGAELDLNQEAFGREQELYNKKVSSKADYLTALKELKATQASYAAAEKRLQYFGLTTSEIGQITDKKENGVFADLVIRAPQSGTIITHNSVVGKMVETTESLYTISDLSNLWVWCDVYEKDLAVLHEQISKDNSLSAIIRVKAFASSEFVGTIDLVGNVMDEQTRTIKMRAQVQNPGNKLRPGLFTTVDVVIPGQERMTVVPRTAVMSDAGVNFVFQHWKDDLWTRKNVLLGSVQGEFAEIQSGLSVGKTIVTSGAFMLKSDILRAQMGAGCAD
jgi:cobalt-zinc-cadmium efflux system membrane fusion protein